MKIIFVLAGLLGLLNAQISAVSIAPFLSDKQFEGIRLLDQKRLVFKDISGIKFSEISDLAYAQKSEKLYFVGDEGKLFVFDVSFSDKIDVLKPLRGVKLVKGNGDEFAPWHRDSEGLALDDKGRLFVSFEGRAKIGRFDEKGRMLQQYDLPRKLRDPKNYRSRNKSLEALAWHPVHGLLTAAEWPLRHRGSKDQTIYGLSGKEWKFKAEAEHKSAVVAMEVMDDGNILVMERSYTGILKPFVVTLKKVYLNECNTKQAVCKSEVLAKMNSHKGWTIDNFEGLARIAKHRYVIVSDDNDNFFQQTLLIYFEVKH